MTKENGTITLGQLLKKILANLIQLQSILTTLPELLKCFINKMGLTNFCSDSHGDVGEAGDVLLIFSLIIP